MLKHTLAARRLFDQRAIKTAAENDPAVAERRQALHPRNQLLRQAAVANDQRPLGTSIGRQDLPRPGPPIGKQKLLRRGEWNTERQNATNNESKKQHANTGSAHTIFRSMPERHELFAEQQVR